MEIRISAKAFAEFVIGGPAKKSSTVRNILKPKSIEAIIPVGYYKRAIGIIRGYHDRNNDYSYVRREMSSLQEEVETSSTHQARTRRNSNMLAVECYMKAFASRRWKVIACPRIYHSSGEVRISGTPDLAVQDSGRLRLVKLGVRKGKESSEMVRLMLRVIYQAARTKLDVSVRDITYFDVRTGDAISGEPDDRRLAKTIEGGCRVLQLMIQGKAA